MFDSPTVSIGTDIVDVSRIKRVVSRFGEAFLNKIFTSTEIEYCIHSAHRYQSLAARFAAKEAFAKAVGSGIGAMLVWHDVEVKNVFNGQPRLELSERARLLMRRLGFCTAKISLSHTKTLAQAVVILIS